MRARAYIARGDTRVVITQALQESFRLRCSRDLPLCVTPVHNMADYTEKSCCRKSLHRRALVFHLAVKFLTGFARIFFSALSPAGIVTAVIFYRRIEHNGNLSESRVGIGAVSDINVPFIPWGQ